MAPEPDQHTILARAAYHRALEGDDLYTVFLWVAREAVKLERRRLAQSPSADISDRSPFADPLEDTPTVDLWAQHEPLPQRPVAPSQRPTVAPRASSGTRPRFPPPAVPPPLPRGVKPKPK